MNSFDRFFNKKEEEEEVPAYISAIMPNVKRFLDEREIVSMPHLQLHYSLSYSETRALVEHLIKYNYIFGEPIGLGYRVNKVMLAAQELSYEEIVYIGAVLRGADVEALRKFRNGTTANEHTRKTYSVLIKEGVIVEDNEKLYSAYGEESLNALTELSLSDEDWFMEKVIYELMSALDTGFRMHSLLNNSVLLPDEFKEAIKERMANVKAGGKAPRDIRRSFNYDRLKYRFIETALKRLDFDNAESYSEATLREINNLRRYGLEDSDTYTVLRLAHEEIAMLDIKAIWEIKALIND